MNNHSMILEMAASREMLIAWAILLLAALLIIFWYVARKVESRSAAVILAGMILLVSVGQFAAFLWYYVPTVKQESRLLREKITLIELDNVKERDIALAYQRENATLNQTVRSMRGKIQDLEERTSGESDRQPAPAGIPATAVPEPEGVRGKPAPPKRVAAGREGSRPQEAATSPPPPKRKKWFQPRKSNTRYRVTILTPESNAPLARTLEESLKVLLFQTGEPLLIDVDENRIIYYSDEDTKRAAYLGAFLKYKYKIDAPLKLSPNKQHQGSFQVYLKP